jgi:hypothetical protein
MPSAARFTRGKSTDTSPITNFFAFHFACSSLLLHTFSVRDRRLRRARALCSFIIFLYTVTALSTK